MVLRVGGECVGSKSGRGTVLREGEHVGEWGGTSGVAALLKPGLQKLFRYTLNCWSRNPSQ